MGFFDGFWQSDQAQQTTPTGDPAPQYGQQYGLLGNSQGLADFVNQHGQSMMGMGMGLMSGNRGMGDALTGWQAGAKQDMLASIQTEKRKKDQMAREAALSFAKSRGLSPAQTAMLIANPEVAAHVLQTQLEPKEKSLTDQIIASLPADQRQEYINRQILGRKDEKSLRKWDTIGEDEFGNKIKGWVDANDKSVDPYRPGDNSAPRAANGEPDGPATQLKPMGVPVPENAMSGMPPGTDPKEWRKIQTERLGREQTAKKLGMKPGDPAYAAYVATGKMPREDAQPMTATDKRAIQEADDNIISARTAITSLDRALDLSKKAYAGPIAAIRGKVTGALGNEAGQATTLFDNEVTANSLASMKAIFGANPTEGERKILLEVQGISSQPQPVRERILTEARERVNNRLEQHQQRANELRGGSYYKPGGGSAASGGNDNAPAKVIEGSTLPVRKSGIKVYNKATGQFE